MKVIINFEPNDILKELLSLSGEWNFPFFPSIGEEVSPSLLEDWITPSQLYDALNESEKEVWNKWVNDEVEAGSTEEAAQWDNLHIWLGNLGTVVSGVSWSKLEGEYYVQISLEH